MPKSDFTILADDRPENLPSRKEIITLCKKAGYKITGIPFRNQPSGPVVAWIKYGPNVTMDEAYTQDWVAKVLNAEPETDVTVPRVYVAFMSTRGIGYIVMEFIDAPDCTSRDVKLVAQAIKKLISIRGPSLAPGHVGGGHAVHTFFVDDRTAPFPYETVKELEEHVNGILKFKGDPRRVDLVADTRNGLFLCPWDIHPGNFKKVGHRVVALDFCGTCFLPPSFFAVAMELAYEPFTQRVAGHVTYPKSDDVAAIVSAHYYLIPFGKSELGAPLSCLGRKGPYT
ncbi:hypothetical protein BOTBODRAFT_175989 [Botryobasidium botryosum FD-172 SS1]|uniref:Aminoglycoside phosphotransferase domain-containing protein n=1 Tax=Botryobasidium botryosum (strain FD-172 SS1) TaxID=930990 RepID=A0A067MAU2_BOTB1|nr:hypothetical protein BOTBODRAFT_175989 [Botryobasidium botryosum FD-172 SS1]